MPGGAYDAPLWRLIISPTATATAAGSSPSTEGGNNPKYNKDNLPTPASLVADLQATANFKSAIADLNDDGSRAPLPYLGYLSFPCADEVHEDGEKQYLFPTFEELVDADAAAAAAASGADEEGQPYTEEDRTYHEDVLRSRAQHAALKQYVLNQRVFFVLLHTDRRQYDKEVCEEEEGGGRDEGGEGKEEMLEVEEWEEDGEGGEEKEEVLQQAPLEAPLEEGGEEEAEGEGGGDVGVEEEARNDMSSDVLLFALGVSPASGNLVGVMAIQCCHNLCD